jgi:hypothetical protein
MGTVFWVLNLSYNYLLDILKMIIFSIKQLNFTTFLESHNSRKEYNEGSSTKLMHESNQLTHYIIQISLSLHPATAS